MRGGKGQAVKKTDPPASLAKTRQDLNDTPTTATTATTRSEKAFHTIMEVEIYLHDTIDRYSRRWTKVLVGTEAISGREKRRSRLLASPRQDLIPQLQQLQELRVADPPASLAKTRPDTPTTATTGTTRSGGLRCLSAQKRSLAVKKTDPPASLAKTRPDTPTTATTGTTATTRKSRCLSAQKRSLAVKKADPSASLAKTRPDTPTTGTTATTATTRRTTATTRSKTAFHTIYLSSTRWTQMPIGTEAISGREKRRSRLLASPRQDLIPQLQQLQELRVAVDSKCLSAQKRSLAVKKTDPPASLAKTRPDTPTTATTGTTATTRSGGLRCLSAQKRSLAVKKTDPPASLAKTRPDTPTTATTGTTATTRSGGLRCLSAQKRSLAVKKTDPPASLAKTRPDTPTTATTGTTATTRKSRCLSAQKRSLAVIKADLSASLAKTRPDTPTTATTATTRTLSHVGPWMSIDLPTSHFHLSVSRLCVYRKFVMRNRSQKNIPHARPPFCRVVSTLAPHIPGTSAVDFVMAYMNAPPDLDPCLTMYMNVFE
ncbi:hypothetical protein Bbelb_211300 [Branchiostoma belcheri]|nr:hypothetical protein Bbelb_211300 [Branchiostoma belcheri]